MIERAGKTLTFECDVCDSTEEFEGLDFGDAWMELQRKGWRCKKVGGEFVHGCPQHARSI